MQRKPILCLDFDGVIHSYDKGWQNGEIYGTTTPGFWGWIAEAVKHFEIVVYSSRSSTTEGVRAMREWLGTQSIDKGLGELGGDFEWPLIFDHVTFSDRKPPAFLTIDDRGMTFNGNWKDFDPVKLRQFKPWNVS